MGEAVTLSGGRTVDVSKKDARRFKRPNSTNELEVKIFPEREPKKEFDRVQGILIALKAKRVFKGSMTTWWFLSPRGVSRRVRRGTDTSAKEPDVWFSWTIKTDPNGGHQATRVAKSRDEYEQESDSFAEAKLHLAIANRLLEIPMDLPRKPYLSVAKKRIAFSVPLEKLTKKEKKGPRHDRLEVALDTYRKVNGTRIDPVRVLEIQDTSPHLSAEVKQKRIAALAAQLGLTANLVIAPLSTEGLLRHLGIVRLEVVE